MANVLYFNCRANNWGPNPSVSYQWWGYGEYPHLPHFFIKHLPLYNHKVNSSMGMTLSGQFCYVLPLLFSSSSAANISRALRIVLPDKVIR